MTKIAAIIIVFFAVLLQTPTLAFAKPPTGIQAKIEEKQENKKHENEFKLKLKIEGDSLGLQQFNNQNSSPSAQTCDPNFPWKNHGQYVSCVARNGSRPHRLGGPGNSAAARSNIGKPGFVPPPATDSAEPDDSTESADILDATPSATPSANVSIKIKASGTLDQIINFLEGLLALLQGLL